MNDNDGDPRPRDSDPDNWLVNNPLYEMSPDFNSFKKLMNYAKNFTITSRTMFFKSCQSCLTIRIVVIVFICPISSDSTPVKVRVS